MQTNLQDAATTITLFTELNQEPLIQQIERGRDTGEQAVIDPEEQVRKSNAAILQASGREARLENPPPNIQSMTPDIRHSVFPKGTCMFVVLMAAICGTVSPLSGNIYYPALNPLAAELHVSQSLINISLTTYMIFQGISPTFMGNLAGTNGRRPAYIIGLTIYIGACIGLALQTSYPALLVLRCFQSTGSSSTIALGSAVAADVATAAERGTYMGLINCGALVGPALGPVLGGILSAFLGWRSIFWFLGQNVVGNGSIPTQRWNRDLLTVIGERRKQRLIIKVQADANNLKREGKAKRKLRMPNPLVTLKILKEKDFGLLLLYNCLIYASYFSVTSSLPYLFAKLHGFNDLQIGLSYLPYGVGALLASIFNGRAPLAAPLVLLFFVGYCISGSFNCCSVVLIDYYPMSPATAAAGNNLCRCLLGAGEAAVIIQMIESMGCEWCFTFIALVIFATTRILGVLMQWVPEWREKRAQRLEAEKVSGA
ncbi:bicyclomycin resistance protein, putative [Talaromyces stipitatus ATCC 10500]|uniref:Bicyclomycin resistance protein, putative n=1 Tax=Talaromyces stipitatus (strain ATCC 10500 / CBS 375.48 / QM 6759 / NRRL 1006) TaxID=441959 RepID=B8MB39_TALSN|nr:bicyclomycin resistance protein, putative [Talaromyces stipitatus ATCC 10500]EED18740.1 bicyclomycin resistance protein, putative [Talaromyces stipitatus ATCC 10500]